ASGKPYFPAGIGLRCEPGFAAKASQRGSDRAKLPPRMVQPVPASHSPFEVVSSFLAAVIGTCLFAWILLRGARSTPTRLMAVVVGSLAELQGFQFLWLRHPAVRSPYIHLQFIGAVLAPCLVFHYAMSLAPPMAFRRWAVAAVYAIGSPFLMVAVGGL